MRHLRHTLNAVIYSDGDQWIAHCLELDLVTQGNTAEHAVEMIAEAIELVAESNVWHGQPPLTFRSAPAEDWDRLRGAEEVATRLLRFDGSAFTDEVTLAPVVTRAA